MKVGGDNNTTFVFCLYHVSSCLKIVDECFYQYLIFRVNKGMAFRLPHFITVFHIKIKFGYGRIYRINGTILYFCINYISKLDNFDYITSQSLEQKHLQNPSYHKNSWQHKEGRNKLFVTFATQQIFGYKTKKSTNK